MNDKQKNIVKILSLFLIVGLAVIACTEDDEVFEKTRLFRPVLNERLSSEANTIIVDMGSLKEAVSYTLEVSRDTFKTIDYTIDTDTSYVVIDKSLVGEELLWDTRYQVQATAHASDPQYDSKVSDLGGVRTSRFPSVLNAPATYDVTDVAARVTWTVSGAPITMIKVFSISDLRLEDPLNEYEVPTEDQETGETFIDGLDPSTGYQIAIYSGDNLRGWVKYFTLAPDIDPTDPNVIDVRDDPSPSAVSDAVATAMDGNIILVKRGVVYDLPSENLNKSITIQAAHGFGEQKATLFTTGNWDIDDGSTIDHIRFIDLELRGEDMGGDYVFNPNRSDVAVGEVLFDNCTITTFRGIMRIRSTTMIDNFKIMNCVVDSIGGYGLLTTDTNPGDPMTAHVNNILFSNSTFSEVEIGIQSRNNSESLTIDNCTFYNFIADGGRLFRYRGGEGNDNVLNGITITNSIFGHPWDENGAGSYGGIKNEGLGQTTVSVINTYSTANFSFSGNELPGFPIGNYAGTSEQLWVDPDNNDFHIQDSGFAGLLSAGDPRWRPAL